MFVINNKSNLGKVREKLGPLCLKEGMDKFRYIMENQEQMNEY